MRKLKKVREKNQVTQRTLSQRMKTSQSYVARLEYGHVCPRIDIVARYAHALGCVIKFQVQEEEDDTTDT
jgi:predicted transcriptional regulator